ncbi:acetate kinase, partial [Lactobacillus crispatus]
MKKVLAINSGSSSFKYKLFSFPDEKVIASGMADRVGMDNAVFKIKLNDDKEYIKNTSIPDQEAAVSLLIENLKKFHVLKNLDELFGVGHRVVNGGEVFKDSVLIDKQKLQQIFDLGELAPLHNVPEAMGIKAFMKIVPDV